MVQPSLRACGNRLVSSIFFVFAKEFIKWVSIIIRKMWIAFSRFYEVSKKENLGKGLWWFSGEFFAEFYSLIFKALFIISGFALTIINLEVLQGYTERGIYQKICQFMKNIHRKLYGDKLVSSWKLAVQKWFI